MGELHHPESVRDGGDYARVRKAIEPNDKVLGISKRYETVGKGIGVHFQKTRSFSDIGKMCDVCHLNPDVRA
jgi:hypothetical protein